MHLGGALHADDPAWGTAGGQNRTDAGLARRPGTGPAAQPPHRLRSIPAPGACAWPGPRAALAGPGRVDERNRAWLTSEEPVEIKIGRASCRDRGQRAV